MHLRTAVIEVVFGFLRPRRQVPAALSRPLRSAQWEGDMLTLAFDEGASGDIALDLDGCFFSSAPIDGERCARFAFAFSPSGRTAIDAMARLGRDGPAFAAAPLRLRFGTANIVAAAAGEAPGALASLGAPAQLVPFGVDAATPEVAIVVPVYNAPTLVARCLDAVLAHTTGRVRLIVIDDASPDPAVAPLLARYADIAGVCLLRNDSNRGFTATANRGIGTAGTADVVLLNADTEVGPNWLQGLRRAAYAGADVGTATAVSDNAGAFSVPELEQANPLPTCWTFDASARALWQHAGLAYPSLPTGNGFCLYIRRTVIDAVGLLDEAAFPQGYGEENDFCQRAAPRGFRHLIAGNVLVKHARSGSFGEERRLALGRAGMAVLRERYPDYENEVGATLFSFERRVLDWRVRRIFAKARADNAAKPRVLWVGAGAPEWADAEVWNLRANGARNELMFDDKIVAANGWKADDAEASYRALWEWLQLYAIERLAVTQTNDSAAEILCGLLDIPVVCLDQERDDCTRFAAPRRIGVAQFSGTAHMSGSHSCTMITGISGQDGALLAAHLLRQGCDVVGTHRPGREPDLWRLCDLGIDAHPRLHLVALDPADAAACAEAVARVQPDAVFHLAGQSRVADSFRDPQASIAANGLSTVNLLEAVRANVPRAHLVLASSAEIFGAPEHAPQNEDTPLAARSPYGLSKLIAYAAVASWRASFGLRASSAILFNHESELRDIAFVTRKLSLGVAHITLGTRAVDRARQPRCAARLRLRARLRRRDGCDGRA